MEFITFLDRLGCMNDKELIDFGFLSVANCTTPSMYRQCRPQLPCILTAIFNSVLSVAVLQLVRLPSTC